MLIHWATNLFLQQGLRDMRNHQEGTLMHKVFILPDNHSLSLPTIYVHLTAGNKDHKKEGFEYVITVVMTAPQYWFC